MTRVMVRYKVKPEQVARNEELVRAVYEELHRAEPNGLRYATFKLPDGVTFVHLADHDGEGNPLDRPGAFKAFQAGVARALRRAAGGQRAERGGVIRAGRSTGSPIGSQRTRSRISAGRGRERALDRLPALAEVLPALVVDRDRGARPHEAAQLDGVLGGHRVAQRAA